MIFSDDFQSLICSWVSACAALDRRSALPRRFPIEENGWHGKPAENTWISFSTPENIKTQPTSLVLRHERVQIRLLCILHNHSIACRAYIASSNAGAKRHLAHSCRMLPS